MAARLFVTQPLCCTDPRLVEVTTDLLEVGPAPARVEGRGRLPASEVVVARLEAWEADLVDTDEPVDDQ